MKVNMHEIGNKAGAKVMDMQKVKELALANGFKLKEQSDGNMDLNAYVYDFANAIEQAAKAQAIPEGFVVVPKVPTQKMLDATINVPIPAVYVDSISGQHRLKVAAYYKAMINEAQEPAND